LQLLRTSQAWTKQNQAFQILLFLVHCIAQLRLVESTDCSTLLKRQFRCHQRHRNSSQALPQQAAAAACLLLLLPAASAQPSIYWQLTPAQHQQRALVQQQHLVQWLLLLPALQLAS
jgi:hypothetical protein